MADTENMQAARIRQSQPPLRSEKRLIYLDRNGIITGPQREGFANIKYRASSGS
jgi:hypothetical protein